jgi:hypothetical protein
LAGHHGFTHAWLFVVFPARVAEAEIRIVLRLPGDGVSIDKKKLEIGILEMVVTANVNSSVTRSSGVRAESVD